MIDGVVSIDATILADQNKHSCNCLQVGCQISYEVKICDFIGVNDIDMVCNLCYVDIVDQLKQQKKT